MTLHNRAYLREKRKDLRNGATPAEAELWKYLKGGQLLGRKFRRQHSIGNYILDFYCPSEKVAVELDGQVHHSALTHNIDYERDGWLEQIGITVIRFENKEIFAKLETVLHEISSNFSK